MGSLDQTRQPSGLADELDIPNQTRHLLGGRWSARRRIHCQHSRRVGTELVEYPFLILQRIWSGRKAASDERAPPFVTIRPDDRWDSIERTRLKQISRLSRNLQAVD